MQIGNLIRIFIENTPHRRAAIDAAAGDDARADRVIETADAARARADAQIGAEGEREKSALQLGFLALAFGSDLRIGARPRGIRRFDHPIRARVVASGSVDRSAAMRRILDEYADKVPNLHL